MATQKELVILELKAQGSKQTAEELSRVADSYLEMGESIRRTSREMNKLIPTQGRHNKETRNSNGNYKDAASGMRMMRGGAAQLGYQIQDVAVQLQMGQNAMMVFAQQGSQIASLMGGGGAMFGAILAISAGLVTYYNKTHGAASATVNLKEKIEELAKSYGHLTESQKAYLQAQKEEESQQKRDAAATISKQIERLKQVRERYVQMEQGLVAWDQVFYEAWKGKVGTLDLYNAKLKELESAQQLATREAMNLAGEANNVAKGYRDAASAADQFFLAVYGKTEAQLDAEDKVAQERIDTELMLYNTFAGFRNKALEDEKKAAEEKIAIEQLLYDTFKGFDEKKAEDEKAALDRFFDNFAEETRVMEERNARIKQLNEGALQSYGDMFGGIGDMMKDGSRAQMAAFAVQKGVAVGQAIMNLHRAVSEANTLPFPANMAAIAQAVATGTASIAGIKSASFEGGGYTGMGTRSGGVDGKGGFPAILHPNETIIDHTKGQSSGAVTVNLNISAVDASGFDKLLSSRRGQIVGMINQAVNNRGRPSIA